MNKVIGFPILGLIAVLATASAANGQATPYIGYVYPAGGQQGSTFQIQLGGQRIDGVSGATISGEGASAKLVKYYRKLSNQEMTLLRQQLKVLRQQAAKNAKAKPKVVDTEADKLIAAIQKRISEWVNRPACAALSAIAIIEVTVAPGAKPGAREIRLVTGRGMTNPMVFHIGQVPEVARKPMRTCPLQVLGKEGLAQRKRPADEVEARVTVPCTMNGQIASGEVNHYRFEATKGQRLVVSVAARELIPYIADAVPGWFQPVLTLYDADGKEVAFSDDYRFKPDPTLYFEVPKSGEYVLTITDALYRGREDFVYRITLGEVPFITSIFPLGGRIGQPADIEMEGWNLAKAKLNSSPMNARSGMQQITAKSGKFVSNSLPFALDTLPECFDQESNNEPAHAQKVEIPIIVNGRADQPGDWDVFELKGRAGQTIVAEVLARRLESPMDSMLKVTDSKGQLLALNDDHEDVGSGINTHHADSYIMLTLPEDGTYHVHLGDTTRSGGTEYAYRLRISEPRPDFTLRVSPSGGGLRSKGFAAANVYAIRRDGFDGDIKLSLKNPPKGFVSSTVTLPNGKDMVRLGVRTTLIRTDEPVNLTVEGRATVGDQVLARQAVPSEDRMQAFLWRHLVPAEQLQVVVYAPSYRPAPTRVPPAPSAAAEPKTDAAKAAAKPTFSKRQVAGRLRQLKLLYEEWLLSDEFYALRVAECESMLD